VCEVLYLKDLQLKEDDYNKQANFTRKEKKCFANKRVEYHRF